MLLSKHPARCFEFTPIDLNTRLVNRVEILTGSGTWSPPVGVNEFRAVLIQGGGAGESGENGANATTATVKSQSNTTTIGQGYVTPFFSNLRNSTSGGNGGAGGDGGVGGKIYEADFSNTDGKSYPYKIGHGLKVEGGNTLAVNAVSDFSGDNTLPITAAAVQETVGNIEIILGTI